MTWDAIITLIVTFGVLGSLIATSYPPHLILLGAMTLLSVSGVLSAQEALAGFSNTGLITVAAMFIIAAGIHASGGVDLVVNRILGKPKTTARAIARLCIPTAMFSGFLNNTPVVATLIPAAISWSKRINIAPSKLLLPLSYSAILGGTLTLIGTSTNLIVDGQYQTLTGHDSLGMFAITLVGLPVAVTGLLLIIFWMPRRLPNHQSDQAFGNLREFTLEVAIANDGPLVGQTVAAAGLRALDKVYLVEIERAGSIVTAVSSEEKLRGGDRLVFAGPTDAITDLLRIRGVVPSTSDAEPLLSQSKAERCLVEAVVSPHCDCIGETIRHARFRDRYGAVVLAVARNGQRVKGNLGSVRLKAGDALLLEARPAFVSRQRHVRDFLLVNDLETENPRHDRAALAWLILFTVVGLATVNLLSMMNAALLGAAAMLLTGCCSSARAQKSLDLPVLMAIAASFSLGAAIEKTGLASALANSVIELGAGKPILLLALTYAVVSLLTEVITNNAAAIIALPIALALSTQTGLPAEPFVIAVMMAASASFASPLGYQTNLMVYGPGGYRFVDFLKVGIPMNLLTGVVSVSVISLIWLN